MGNPLDGKGLNHMNALTACCLTQDNTTVTSLFFFGSFLYQRAKPPQGNVLFINPLGTGLTLRVCMEDGLFFFFFNKLSEDSNTTYVSPTMIINSFWD